MGWNLLTSPSAGPSVYCTEVHGLRPNSTPVYLRSLHVRNKKPLLLPPSLCPFFPPCLLPLVPPFLFPSLFSSLFFHSSLLSTGRLGSDGIGGTTPWSEHPSFDRTYRLDRLGSLLKAGPTVNRRLCSLYTPWSFLLLFMNPGILFRDFLEETSLKTPWYQIRHLKPHQTMYRYPLVSSTGVDAVAKTHRN